jgi:NADPH-dependent 2,4-dienoyl-CoA reductase/sulfur reductase-like enzyme
MQDIARRCEAAGLAFISVSGGTFGGLRVGITRPYVSPSYSGEAINVDDAAGIKRAVSIPVIVTGRILDMDTAERVVAGGQADIIGLTRALIADPTIVATSFAGRAGDVTPCIGCNECHYGRPTSCAVNSAAGREEEMAIEPVAEPRRVLVIGAGPAGMECARVASLRGHDVTLVEQRSCLGGVLSVLRSDPPRAEFGRYVDHLGRLLENSSVTIETGVTATPDVVGARRPDVVIVATGAEQRRPPVPGITAAHVVTAEEVFAGTAVLGAHVVVVGGIDDHLAPLTTADLVARSGRRVTLLSELLHPGQRIEAGTLHVLTARLLDEGVTLMPLTALAAVDERHVEVRNSLTNRRGVVSDVESVVLATMRYPYDPLSDALRAAGYDVRLIGDCLAPRRLLHATTDGARAAMAL